MLRAAVSSVTASPGEVADTYDRRGRFDSIVEVGSEEREIDFVTDTKTGPVGHHAIDEHLVSCIGIGEPTGAQLRKVQGKVVVGRGEQRARVRRIDSGGGTDEAGVDPLARHARDRSQRRFGHVGRRSVLDGGIGRVRRREDALIGRRRAPRRGEAREAEAEPDPEQHTGNGERQGVMPQPPPRDVCHRPHPAHDGRTGVNIAVRGGVIDASSLVWATGGRAVRRIGAAGGAASGRPSWRRPRRGVRRLVRCRRAEERLGPVQLAASNPHRSAQSTTLRDGFGEVPVGVVGRSSTHSRRATGAVA